MMKPLDEYLEDRWNKMPDSAKRVLNAYDDPIARMNLQLHWSLQWVKEREAELASLQVGG
jgi:hypothetical protein